MGSYLTSCAKNFKQKWLIYQQYKEKKYLDTLLESATNDNTPWLSFEGIECMAKCVDIYDGDTLTLVIPFGNKVFKRKCRLLNLDTAEIRTKNDKEKAVALDAKKFVSSLILNKMVFVKCDKDDKYGRLLVQLFVTREDLNNGTDLSSQIVNIGLGYVYDGKTKKSFDEWYRQRSTNVDVNDALKDDPNDIVEEDGELITIDVETVYSPFK